MIKLVLCDRSDLHAVQVLSALQCLRTKRVNNYFTPFWPSATDSRVLVAKGGISRETNGARISFPFRIALVEHGSELKTVPALFDTTVESTVFVGSCGYNGSIVGHISSEYYPKRRASVVTDEKINGFNLTFALVPQDLDWSVSDPRRLALQIIAKFIVPFA